MTIEIILRYLTAITRDSRLTVWYKGVIMSIFYLGRENATFEPILIGRQRIMDIARISNPTYHKCRIHPPDL
ncbi:hypothetical protein CLV42_117111 [Chitinophaga ginsengisoli]|uniref:Uncharacterized protein n=1 Tax=Chitinophaga ginsengisoli TaxID=363837 RepID=A0A2P8FPW5_9BACT|nr:hypothetical protein CLV42_117111 [Chitinophaga ginsengisoli]